MNYNVGAYIIFLLIMCFIIFFVGRKFYTNGRVFIIALFNGQKAQADGMNKLLLIAYYLFNTGYAFLKLKQWQRISSLESMLSSLATNIGLLVLILAGLHYFNIYIIYRLSKSNSITHKSFQR